MSVQITPDRDYDAFASVRTRYDDVSSFFAFVANGGFSLELV